MNAVLEAALQYAARGWPVFRVTGYKTPLRGTHGHKDATTDPELVQAWWGETPWVNVGMPTGNIVVFDADGPGGEAQLQALAEAHGGVPDTLKVLTSRGAHYYFLAPRGVHLSGNNQKRKKGEDGLDIKGWGGFVVLPPSVNKKSGFRYEWVNNLPIAVMPPWLVQYALERCPKYEPFAETSSPAAGGWDLGPVPAYCRGGRGEAWLEAQRLHEFPAFVRALRKLGPIGAGIRFLVSGRGGHLRFRSRPQRAGVVQRRVPTASRLRQ